MSTSAQIRTAWNTRIWTNATVTAITPQIFAYDTGIEQRAQKEIDSFYYNQKINFFTYLVMRTRRELDVAGGTSNGTRYIHTVQLFYYLEKDISDSDYNYNGVIDALETVDGLVISQLGKTWNSTVNYYEMTDARSPILVEIDGKRAWRGQYVYAGYHHA